MESHLLQMRGLKPIVISTPCVAGVASFTDAWIETAALGVDYDYEGRIFYRCVD